MKRVRTYQRSVEEARAALDKYPLVITRGDRASLSLAIGLLEDITAELHAIKQREKARRERIQWLSAGNHTYVAKVGRKTYRVVFGSGYGSLSMFDGLVFAYIGKTGTSVESASRKIRAWRKRK